MADLKQLTLTMIDEGEFELRYVKSGVAYVINQDGVYKLGEITAHETNLIKQIIARVKALMKEETREDVLLRELGF